MEEKTGGAGLHSSYESRNGEIYACVNVPEFDLNDPFTLNTEETAADGKKKQDLLNQMWRNPCLNDTYEPGSTFKIITMAAGLEEGVVSTEDRFFCPGYKVVEDRRIHCAKRTGHGAQNFVEGAQNSCNPVFIEVGLRLGVDNYYKYFKQFGLLKKQELIFREKLERSCITRKIWERWNLPPYPLASRFRSRRSSWQQRSVRSSMAETGSLLILGSVWKAQTEQKCRHWNIRWKRGSCPKELHGQYGRFWKR